MKRMSYRVLALGLCLAAACPPSAYAVNPAQLLNPNSSVNPGTSTPTYNPALLPGNNLGFGLGNQSDPFFNPNLYSTTPIYPNMGTNPAINPTLTVPNPNPNTYIDPNRSRGTVPGVTPSFTQPSPGTTSDQRKWRLGVYSKDLDTGVKIYEVVAGGAAARAGLEVNDLIVAVNGYQVGFVNGQLFDCGTEFERLADRNGWVSLLVQNNRNGQLVNVPVQLDSRLANLRGTVSWEPRTQLPTNATVNVELKEIVGNNSQAVTFASTQIRQINSYPVQFTIDFDPAQISRTGRYAIYASIVHNNREIYRTTQLQRVLENGQNRTVALQLSQVSNSYVSNMGSVNLNQDAQVAQIVRWFQDYLGRDPSDRELANWLEAISKGYPMAQVQLDLLGHNQFFNRCDGDKTTYIVRMHELLIGRQPSRDELAYWLSRYDAQNGIRRELAREFQGALGIH